MAYEENDIENNEIDDNGDDTNGRDKRNIIVQELR